MQLDFPKSKDEVILWGKVMNNCYNTRAEPFFNGRVKLLGLKDSSGTLVWVLEVVNNSEFGHFETYTQIHPNTEFLSAFRKFLRLHGII